MTDGDATAGIPLFEGVAGPLRERVTPKMVRHYIDGDRVLKAGAAAEELLIVLDGSLRIEVGGVLLTQRHAFDVVGEQAFIDETARSADVIAEGSAEVLAIPTSTVSDLMQDDTFARNLLRSISNKLRESTDERGRRYRIQLLLFSEFRAHVNENVLNDLLREGREYGSPRLTKSVVLFSDIRDFTSRCGRMDPEQISSELSDYFSEVVDIVHDEGGLVDKFIGDAVMAVWGYADWDDDFPQKALSCGVRLVRQGLSMTFGGNPIRAGVGLNVGEVFMGNVGSHAKRQFTVVGTPVNLTARFESASKTLRAPIVMGPDFVRALPLELVERFTECPEQEVKGADEKLTLYTYDPEPPGVFGATGLSPAARASSRFDRPPHT